MTSNETKKITFGGLMVALVFVTTFSIKIPVPFTQGYIHAGDSMIFIAAILLGWKYGALAGGVGSALADILGGYANWAIPTLLIKTVMGALVGWIAQDAGERDNKTKIILSVSMAIFWLGLTSILKSVIAKSITMGSTHLIGEVDGITTIEELLVLSQKVQNQLFWAAILIPVVIILLSLYLSRIDKKLFTVDQLLGMLVAGLWMVIGYYVAAGIMYGSFIVPIFSIPWNIVQFAIGLAIAYFIILALRKTPIMKYLEDIK